MERFFAWLRMTQRALRLFLSGQRLMVLQPSGAVRGYGVGVPFSRKVDTGSPATSRLVMSTTAGTSPALFAVWITSASSKRESPALSSINLSAN